MGVAVVTGQAVVNRSGVTLLARIVGNGGMPITQASLSTIQYALTDFGSGSPTPGSPGPANPAPTTGALASLTISSVVFDSLQQNDPRWTKDSAANLGSDGAWGYNFLATLAATLFTTANRQQCVVVFTPVTGQPFRCLFQWQPVESYI